MPALACAVLLAGLSGCAAPPPYAEHAADIEVTPIGRVVSTTEFPLSSIDFRRFARNQRNTIPDYEQKFRPPGPADGPLLLGCAGLVGFGVILQVDFSDVPQITRQRRLRFRWSHSAIELEGSRFDYLRSPITLGFGRRLVVEYATFLEIHYEWARRDGTYRVDVSYRGHDIFHDEFSLVGCDDPQAPDWYEG